MTLSHKSARPLSASLLAPKGEARPSQSIVTEHGQPRHLFDMAVPAPTPQTVHPTPNADTSPAPDASTATQKKAAFTFRVCEQRHFRLRLLSAHQNRSSQKIMEAALDAYLETHAPQTAGMACPCFQTGNAE